jgi:hypothetical protein
LVEVLLMRHSELWKRQGERVVCKRRDVVSMLNAEIALLKRVIRAYDKVLVKTMSKAKNV